MPTIICNKCGRQTNTACSNHIYSKNTGADGCYARVKIKQDEGETAWEKGCAYETAHSFDRRYADSLCGVNVDWQKPF